MSSEWWTVIFRIWGRNLSDINNAVVNTLCASRPSFLGGPVEIKVYFSARMQPSVERASEKKTQRKIWKRMRELFEDTRLSDGFYVVRQYCNF